MQHHLPGLHRPTPAAMPGAASAAASSSSRCSSSICARASRQYQQSRRPRCRPAAHAAQQQQEAEPRIVPAAQSQPSSQPPAAVDPFAKRSERTDSALEKLAIRIFTVKIAEQLGSHVRVPPDAGYEDFVRVSKEIMRGRSTAEQRALVARVLRSLLPSQVPLAAKAILSLERRLFPDSAWSAETNAIFASLGFGWLVGDSEVRTQEVEVAPGQVRSQASVVHIKKCRYLEASGCVGLCVNMCKMPTQEFFTNDFGLPLTMNPNFETLSCDMIFGQAPPPLEEDPVYGQPCFVGQCSLAQQRAVPCPKTDTERGSKQQAHQACSN